MPHGRHLFLVALLASTAAPGQVTWTQQGPATQPSARSMHAVETMSRHGQVLLFGGETTNGSGYLNDTWTYANGAWTHLVSASSTAASRRGGHAMCYDLIRDRVVLFSGWDGARYPNDTWEFDPGTTTWNSPASSTSTAPQGRDWGTLTYDTARQVSVLFGGHDWTLPINKLDDTWLWDGTTWTLTTPATSPGKRFGHAAAYDPGTRRVIMFGGAVDGIGIANDTWAWDGTNWQQLAPAQSPPARVFHAMDYDLQRNRIVMFGGNTNGTLANDVWEWDGSNWLPRTPVTPSPTARYFTDIAFDLTSMETMLFGGSTQIGRVGNVNDTWLYGPQFPAAVQPFGSACGAPALSCGPPAWLGSVFGVTVSGAPAGAPIGLVAGLSNTTTSGGVPLPLSLLFLGIPCNLLVDPVLNLPPVVAPTGTASISFPLPTLPTLAGVSLYTQALVVDFSAPGSVVLTAGCDHSLGGL